MKFKIGDRVTVNTNSFAVKLCPGLSGKTTKVIAVGYDGVWIKVAAADNTWLPSLDFTIR